MAWTYLVKSGLIDVLWALSMKKTQGFQNVGWSCVSLFLLAAFIYLLAKALQVLPVGSAYAIWTGIGAAGTGLLGIILFNEPATFARIAFIFVILVGTIGLKLSSN
jgi:quaternary ammonium compound-resistance protein SugE